MPFNGESAHFLNTESSEVYWGTGTENNDTISEFNPEQAKAEIDQEKLNIVCSETQESFPDSIACFENATHLLYQEITGKKRVRLPDADGTIKDEFRLPKSKVRPLSKDMPAGYILSSSDLAEKMLMENDLLIETPDKKQIFMYGDLSDNPIEGKDFETIDLKNGKKIRVETLGRNIEHIIFHKVYEHDVLRIASDKEQPEEVRVKTSEEAKMLLEMAAVAPEEVNIDQDGEFSDYHAILELMAIRGDPNFKPITSEEERIKARDKIAKHFQASQELKRRKVALVDSLRSYYENPFENNDGDLKFVISGYEKEFIDARDRSTDSSDFLRNFMMSVPGIEAVISDRLKNLPSSNAKIVGDSILSFSAKKRKLI